MTVSKPGNPHGAENEPLATVSFKVDAETFEALKRLEARSGVPNVRGRR